MNSQNETPDLSEEQMTPRPIWNDDFPSIVQTKYF